MPSENKLVIRRDDLPKADREFDITEKDRDLTEAKVLIEGMPAVRVQGGEESVTVTGPSHVGHNGPLQVVVTTKSDKPVGILNYWWNGQEWEFPTPNPDDHRTEEGLSPVMKAIGDGAKQIVAAIEESEGATATTTTATRTAGETATTTPGEAATTTAGGTSTAPTG